MCMKLPIYPKHIYEKLTVFVFFFETHKVSNEIICLEMFLINIPLNLRSARELWPPWFFRPASQHKLKWPNRPSGSTNRPEPWKEYLWLENLGPHWLWDKYRNMEYRKKKYIHFIKWSCTNYQKPLISSPWVSACLVTVDVRELNLSAV